MANKIKISGCEPVKYGPHDFQLGDYVYTPVSLDDPSQGNQLAYIFAQFSEGCAPVYVSTDQVDGRAYDDIYLVPITEEWFKENPQVFTPSDDMNPLEGNPSFSYQYKFTAKRFSCEYRIVVYELYYEDEEEYQRLCREGISYFTCLNESQGKATIAQIASMNPVSKIPGRYICKPTGVMQIVSIHDLQHFLRLCGCEELKVPQSLLED